MAARTALFLVIFLVSAEAAARLDDWMIRGISPFAHPSQERELVVRDAFGRHGKPHGWYKKWRLNGYGFRGPEITPTPSSGTTRFMVLGASECFGMHESVNKDFPTQLRTLLNGHGRYEVVNASMAGMTVASMIGYWEQWASRCRPQRVLVYPAPLFYLAEDVPGESPSAAGRRGQRSEEATFASRFADHLRNIVHTPDTFMRWRNERRLAAILQEKEPGWCLSSVPQARIARLLSDVGTLVASIRRHGALPILATHALRVRVIGPEDYDDLLALRTYLPRASFEVMLQFESAANEAIRDLCRRTSLPMVDLDRHVGSHREYFGDLVHFTDLGASAAARATAETLLRLENLRVAKGGPN